MNRNEALTYVYNKYLMDVSMAFCGETTRHDNWKCGRFVVTLTHRHTRKSMQLDYYLGEGHKLHKDSTQYKRPHILDVLSSIYLDNPRDMSFEEWCSEYGFDDDSRRAERTYNECLKQAKEFNSVFPDALEQMAEDENVTER